MCNLYKSLAGEMVPVETRQGPGNELNSATLDCEIQKRLKHTKRQHMSACKGAGVYTALVKGAERNCYSVPHKGVVAKEGEDDTEIFDFDSWQARWQFLQSRDEEASRASETFECCNNSSKITCAMRHACACCDISRRNGEQGWKIVTSQTQAGIQGCGRLTGCVFCNACFVQFATHGSLKRPRESISLLSHVKVVGNGKIEGGGEKRGKENSTIDCKTQSCYKTLHRDGAPRDASLTLCQVKSSSLSQDGLYSVSKEVTGIHIAPLPSLYILFSLSPSFPSYLFCFLTLSFSLSLELDSAS